MTATETLHQLGNTRRRQGLAQEALVHLEAATRLEPANPTILLNLGLTHLELGRPVPAIETFNRALEIVPAMPEARNILGCALLAAGRTEEARVQLLEALRLRPGYVASLDNLGRVCRAQGRIAEALEYFAQALASTPSPVTHSNYLLTGNYHDGLPPAELVAHHRRWDECHARRWRPAARRPLTPLASRRLRLGYVSPDFCQHAVAFFIAPVFVAHDRTLFEVFCYNNGTKPDAVTAHLKETTEHWREIAALSDDAVAEQIRLDGIDILVDLSGHTARHRLLVFARQPAPVQITWLGYPNTTGLAAMDYRLTDAICLPPEKNGNADQRHGPETLLRLPEVFCCYQPPPDYPAVVASSLPGRPFTYCSFNNLAKLSPSTLAVWAQILAQHPGSRLLLKSPGAGDSAIQASLRAQFQSHAVAPERIAFNGESLPMRQHLELYQECDLALDPFPYNGTTTTCESLLMGVPVVTLAGANHASRVGASFLTCLGLPELIAPDATSYIRVATQLAADPVRLATLRTTLRPRLLASPLGQADRFTRSLETTLLGLIPSS